MGCPWLSLYFFYENLMKLLLFWNILFWEIWIHLPGHAWSLIFGSKKQNKTKQNYFFWGESCFCTDIPQENNTFFHWTIKQTGTRYHHRAFSVQLSGTDLAGRWVRSVAWISLDKTDVSLVYSKMCLGGSIHFEHFCLFLCFEVSGLRYQFVLFALEVVWFLIFPMFSDLFTFRPLAVFWSDGFWFVCFQNIWFVNWLASGFLS